MRIEWKTGRPEINGEYVVVLDFGLVMQVPFSKKFGWNTTGENNKDHAFGDWEVVAWTEAFGKHVIDIYGHRDIIGAKEVENGERLQCD